MEELEENIVDIQERLGGIRSDIADILYDLDNLEIPEINANNSILDLELFKEKLEFYGLYTEEMKIDYNLTMQELKAINKKCEELKWI